MIRPTAEATYALGREWWRIAGSGWIAAPCHPGGGSHLTAGPDIGDYNLDADSDSQGTGERLGAGRDPVLREDNDIFPDHVVGPDRETTGLTGSELADEVDEVTNQIDVEFGPRETPRPRARPTRKKPGKTKTAKTR